MNKKAGGWLIATSILFFATNGLMYADPNLGGQWTFNEKQSDDPHEKFAQAMKDSGNSGGWSGHHHGDHGSYGGGHSSGGYGGGHSSGSEEHSGKGGSHDGGASPFAAPQQLSIAPTDAGLRMIDNSGNDVTYFTDGRKTEREVGHDRKLTSIAHWEADSFVIESQDANGRNIREEFELSTDGKQLFDKLTVPMWTSEKTVTLIRVYDRAPDAGTPQSAPTSPQEN